MVRPQVLRHAPSVVRFVIFLDRETDRERLDRHRGEFLHKRHNQRRVDAAGKKCSERYVTLHAQLDGRLQSRLQLGNGIFFRPLPDGVEVGIPVALDRQLLIAIYRVVCRR